MIMKSDINKLVCILFVHLSSISLENFKDRALVIPEILELIKLHTYKVGLVYNQLLPTCIVICNVMIYQKWTYVKRISYVLH